LERQIGIGEVARQVGINASAIRYYEKEGLLAEPERVGGKRRYDSEVVRRLALIEAAKSAGLSIREIRTLLHGFPADVAASERWRSLASERLKEVDRLIAELRRMRVLLDEALRCECASLDECARLLSDRQRAAQGASS
jgi:MerR family redox-sensitive transcriptional activator SoxR